MAHQVPLAEPWYGRSKLSKMAAMAIEECLADISREEWRHIPLVLCVAERDRPGRFEGLDDQLFFEIQQELQMEFSEQSLVMPHGRVSVGLALMQARKLLTDQVVPHVLIAATDSLIHWPTLSAYDQEQRLLTASNSNGFIPGEGAGALLVGPEFKDRNLICTGVGTATEPAALGSDLPLRGEGLAQAIRAALLESGCAIHQFDFRIADLSGEQYYFKEATLALARIMRVTKEEFDIWHPAECIGESGAVAGLASVAIALNAWEKEYANGPNILCHAANDAGQRAAILLQSRVLL
jgi:3-oxoacyl-[acyl-carrier-protein] synthase I